MNTDESELERDQCKLNIAQTWVDSLRGLRGLRSLASVAGLDGRVLRLARSLTHGDHHLDAAALLGLDLSVRTATQLGLDVLVDHDLVGLLSGSPFSSDLRSDGPKTIFSRQYINCQRDLLRAGERDKTLLARGKPRLLLLEQAIMDGKRKTYAVLTFFTGEILGNVVLVSS